MNTVAPDFSRDLTNNEKDFFATSVITRVAVVVDSVPPILESPTDIDILNLPGNTSSLS